MKNEERAIMKIEIEGKREKLEEIKRNWERLEAFYRDDTKHSLAEAKPEAKEEQKRPKFIKVQDIYLNADNIIAFVVIEDPFDDIYRLRVDAIGSGDESYWFVFHSRAESDEVVSTIVKEFGVLDTSKGDA